MRIKQTASKKTQQFQSPNTMVLSQNYTFWQSITLYMYLRSTIIVFAIKNLHFGDQADFDINIKRIRDRHLPGAFSGEGNIKTEHYFEKVLYI